MTKVEEVARAIYERHYSYFGADAWSRCDPNRKLSFIADARAAIKAMYSPNEAMFNAVIDLGGKISFEEEYKTAIDAALAEDGNAA